MLWELRTRGASAETKAAWDLLPKERSFTHSETEALCKSALSSSAGFNGFWNDIKRVNLIESKDGGYVAVKVAGAVKKTPASQ
jgi:hypothetical protein